MPVFDGEKVPGGEKLPGANESTGIENGCTHRRYEQSRFINRLGYHEAQG